MVQGNHVVNKNNTFSSLSIGEKQWRSNNIVVGDLIVKPWSVSTLISSLVTTAVRQ